MAKDTVTSPIQGVRTLLWWITLTQACVTSFATFSSACTTDFHPVFPSSLLHSCSSLHFSLTGLPVLLRATPSMDFNRRNACEGIAVVQSLSRVRLFVTPWTAACQASLSFTISQTLLKLMSIESVMPPNHPLLLSSPLPSIKAHTHFKFHLGVNFSENLE